MDKMIGAAIGSSLIGAASAKSAANKQSAAASNDLALKKDIYDQTTGFFEPYRNAGENALNLYTQQVGEEYTQSPGYQFGLQGGVDAITAAGSVAGGVQSGATQKALTKFGQDYATGDYNNWLNRVQGMMSSGQNAAGQQAAAGQNYSQGAGNAYANMGNASAAGAIGVGNALQGGISNGLSLYQYQNQLTQPPQQGSVYNATMANGGIY